ncbi:MULTISPECIES: hypothetical protein [Micromonospora]|uniref:MmpS family membrane protein n=1 Tax=Micromonospora solifontis TaxID=2487138 RepID=A0ABX9WC04_9ACTN|nr:MULTISPECIES: hypothetical protein [Micromonospora]NES12667.1 hypothetical protein [Micromonospora sp. PPF5-17B]NES39615.1 hypothetical protein [Micromonospora solifontis]NES54448.1 hypothetical protein [Micromonospora sp. PPF5-6]RNL87926.1 hypothetical protein EFE23_26400 [Micromonospora solifontis]
MSETEPGAPWVPPDPPCTPPEELPTPPAPAGELPDLLAVDAPGGPRSRFGDGGLATIVLAAFAAIALVVCGGLGVASLWLNRPDRPNHRAPVAQPQTTDEPAEPDETRAAQPTPRPSPSPTQKPASTPSNGPGRFAIVYSVTGQGPANIAYRDANGDQIWLDEVPLPWRRTIHTDDLGQVMLQAEKADDKGGRTITCAVTAEGGRPVTETVGPGGYRCGVG